MCDDPDKYVASQDIPPCLDIEGVAELISNGQDAPKIQSSNFKKDLESLINVHSKENGSNTPDFILRQYIVDCLESFDKATRRRDEWYDHVPFPSEELLKPGGTI